MSGQFVPPVPNNSWGPGVARQTEIQWLIDNPAFDERPATMLEFLGPRYLDIDADQNPSLGRQGVIRPGVKKALLEIFGEQVDPGSISEKREAMFTGGIGVGKSLDSLTNVLTPTGWRQIGTLNPGDRVIGSDGKPTTVLGVYPQGELDLYRITFKDGTWVDACENHLWAVDETSTRGIPGTRRTERYLRRRVMSTGDLMSEGLRSGSSYKFRVPLVAPVRYDSEDNLPLDPYLLGLLIANGGLTKGSITLASHNGDGDEMGRYVTEALPRGARLTRHDSAGRNGGAWTIAGTRNMGRTGGGSPVLNAIRELGLHGFKAREKHVPQQYMLASPEARLQLLRGLMDGDGSSYVKNRQVFSTSSPRLAHDVADLVRSLGGYCTVTTFERRGATECQVKVNLGDVCPFRLSRKVANWKPRTNQMPARSIVSIEPVGRRHATCIKVDAPDELYVTKDYIVTHNTTLASVALTYMVHWVSCLHDPQKYFGLMPGSRIAFMLMSTKDSQAKEVLFGDIKARINSSAWFKKNCQYDPKIKNQLRFPKDVWVIPGNSAETTFEGYNILGGILDEGDSHKMTEEKDYAETGYRTIKARITSRFTNPVTGEHRGLLIVIGQMKSAEGFMAKTKRRMEQANARAAKEGRKQNAHVIVMTIWDSFGWESYRDPVTGKVDSFFYDVDRRLVVPAPIARSLGPLEIGSSSIIEIPQSYFDDFDLDPVQALKDHAGIPPNVDDPFIVTPDRIDEAQQKWAQRYPNFCPVSDRPDRVELHELLHASNWPSGALRRAVHIDIGYSAHGDAAGMAMGHIPELVELDGELKPIIVFDFLLRMKPGSGQTLMLKTFRQLVRELRDDRKYKISIVTYDGFQSVESIQLLRDARFNSDELSVDRTKGPYEDLREAIYERRIEFPKYMTYLNRGDTDKVNIARRELLGLQDTGRKIDHQPKGSKDLADAMAGVVHALMRGPNFKRGAQRPTQDAHEEIDVSALPGVHVYGDTVDLTQDEVLRALSVDSSSGGSGGWRAPGPAGLPPLERDPFGPLRQIRGL